MVPLAKTRVSVSCLSPNRVAKQILACLKSLSVASIYRKPKATLLAESLDHVQFYIRLFKEVNGAKRAIVVEVQRRSGCSLSFFSVARTILQSVKDGYKGEDNPINFQVKPPQIQDIGTSECYSHKEREEEKNFALELAADGLIRNSKIDLKMIAMESLLTLTDGQSTEPQISLAAARNILLCDDDKHQDIRRSIFGYVRQTYHDDYPDNDFEERHYLVMHNHALAILANMTHLLSTSGDELQMIMKSEEWIGDAGLLSVLIDELRSAETRPHDAYQAMRCINAIISVSFDVKNRAVELGAQSAIDLSRKVGHCSHEMLARESDTGMVMIGETSMTVSL
eukprot:CAMPEP_0185727874 /NCGR_PEP_ID=MMETSP1171-20130828/3431_1 /TAXON_ID=374046 /ORGANISM="Helicotheca tamensis, Strain CCMP826" /LENGTH=338 /DNA_ID=CAMNT_0028396517 /DNA_START=354 /DNA_END=1370 /DNA_ORIENTATION=+